MALTIREDESEPGGYAFIDLGRALPIDPVRLSFRRQDSEPRFLGQEGWQPEAAWIAAEPVAGRGPNTVLRVGPTVVDFIDELVPVEISADGVGSLGIVVWPHLTRSARRLTELRLGARSPREQAPTARPSRPEPAPQPAVAPAAASASAPAAVIQPAPQAKTEITQPEEKKPKLKAALIAAAVVAVVVLAGAPLALARLGYYGLIAEPRGPVFFSETRAAGATTTQFNPATTVVEVRRADWARWFEGWWLSDPPPAEPVVKDGWLLARPQPADKGIQKFELAPNAGAFPAGQARVQTTVAVRNTASGATTEPITITLRRAPGKPQVSATAPIAFKGPVGGPTQPNRIAFRLSALGLGFHWSTGGTVPNWLELTPAEGDLPDNGSVEVVATLRPAAALLGPGKYENQLMFRAGTSGEFAEQAANLLIEPRAAGRLVVEHGTALDFTGPQRGPFAPQKTPITVKAAGTGFKWSTEGVPQWLELSPAQGELRDNSLVEVMVAVRSAAASMPPGTYEGQFLVRKAGSGDTVTQTARLVIGPPLGQLKLETPAPLVFVGPQGGPFQPAQTKIRLKAVGKGFEWAADSSNYLQVSPAQGKINENGSIEVDVKPAPGTEALTPGTYSTALTFRKKEPGESAVETVRLVVTISFR